MAKPRQVDVKGEQRLRPDTLALPDDTEKQVFRSNVVVAELKRLPEGQFERLLGAAGEGRRADGCCAAWLDGLGDAGPGAIERYSDNVEGLGGRSLAVAKDAKKEVLRADEVMREGTGFFLRQHQNPASLVGEPLEHARPDFHTGLPPGRPG